MAEARASSSAPNTVSFVDVFLAGQRIHEQQYFAAHLETPAQSEGTRRAFSRLARSSDTSFAVDFDLDLAGAGLPQHPYKIPLPFDRHSQLDASLLSGEAHKILFFPEQPVEPRRRNLQTAIIDILDRQHAAQMVAHLRAILDVDTAGLVDVDAQQLPFA